jgi:hypothetical protein
MEAKNYLEKIFDSTQKVEILIAKAFMHHAKNNCTMKTYMFHNRNMALSLLMASQPLWTRFFIVFILRFFYIQCTQLFNSIVSKNLLLRERSFNEMKIYF